MVVAVVRALTNPTNAMMPGFKSRMSCHIYSGSSLLLVLALTYILQALWSSPLLKTKISKFQWNLELVIDRERVYGYPTTKSLFFI